MHVDASNKGTTPKGAAIDNSDQSWSSVFTGNCTHLGPRTGQPPCGDRDTQSRITPLRRICLHGRPHSPDKLDVPPPRNRVFLWTEDATPAAAPFFSQWKDATNHNAIRLLEDTTPAGHSSPAEDATTATAPFLSLQPPPPQPHNGHWHAHSTTCLPNLQQKDATPPSRDSAIHLRPQHHHHLTSNFLLHGRERKHHQLSRPLAPSDGARGSRP